MIINIRSFVREYGALPFMGLTLALSFAAYLLPLPIDDKPLLFPVVIVFIPALVAAGLAAFEGDGAWAKLWRTLRPGRWRWLAIAALIGVAMQAAITLAALALGTITTVTIDTSPLILALAPATLIFALGEEIGWRGYAVRKLLDGGHSPLFATLLTGVPWALVHLSLFLPNMMFVGRPMVAQVASIVAFAFLHTWAFARSGKSVLAPTLLHGLFNACGALFNSGLEPIQATHLGAGVLLVAGAIVFVVDWKWWLAN